jgi:type 2 lantibiotic biosynthesis protein LanM
MKHLKEFSNRVNVNKKLFLDVAEKIGIHLCKTVYWADSRCNWIGKSIHEISSKTHMLYNRALSPEIYEGTSGIALFLSSLYIHKKNEEFYKTAEGAINQALSRLSNINSISRFGLYSGTLGVVYAAIKIGKNQNNNLLIERGLDILNKLQNDFNDPHLMDVINGNASGISVLLDIYKSFNDENILKLAIVLGEELIVTAVKDSNGWSWDHRVNGIESSLNNLTGFSHGAAGIGSALLELYAITKDQKFLESAHNAFSYENHWFNYQNRNWPDFRTQDKVSKNNSEFTYAIAWCHGAPGIGLSRLRAYDLLKSEQYLQDSQSAINTSTQMLEDTINNNYIYDFSLCHGLSGICEILLYANQILKKDSYISLAKKIGIYGIEKYANDGLSWPCGIQGGETPGLMLGLAGIGNFYLRLYEPAKTINPLFTLSS